MVPSTHLKLQRHQKCLAEAIMAGEATVVGITVIEPANALSRTS